MLQTGLAKRVMCKISGMLVNDCKSYHFWILFWCRYRNCRDLRPEKTEAGGSDVS